MKPRLFVVHGYQAQVDSHWFQWLCQQFPDVETHIVALPDPHHPQLSAWLSALQAAIGQVDEQTVIVAHSLGCVTTLRFLSEQTEAAALGGLVLVAGFAEPLVNLPELNGFNREALHWSAVKKHSRNSLVMLSEDDTVVAPEATERLANALHAPLLRLNHRGHFMRQNGCDTLPEVAQWLRQHLPQLTPANGMMSHQKPLTNQ